MPRILNGQCYVSINSAARVILSEIPGKNTVLPRFLTLSWSIVNGLLAPRRNAAHVSLSWRFIGCNRKQQQFSSCTEGGNQCVASLGEDLLLAETFSLRRGPWQDGELIEYTAPLMDKAEAEITCQWAVPKGRFPSPGSNPSWTMPLTYIPPSAPTHTDQIK